MGREKVWGGYVGGHPSRARLLLTVDPHSSLLASNLPPPPMARLNIQLVHAGPYWSSVHWTPHILGPWWTWQISVGELSAGLTRQMCPTQLLQFIPPSWSETYHRPSVQVSVPGCSADGSWVAGADIGGHPPIGTWQPARPDKLGHLLCKTGSMILHTWTWHWHSIANENLSWGSSGYLWFYGRCP